jgi:hypothetical protein
LIKERNAEFSTNGIAEFFEFAENRFGLMMNVRTAWHKDTATLWVHGAHRSNPEARMRLNRCGCPRRRANQFPLRFRDSYERQNPPDPFWFEELFSIQDQNLGWKQVV